MKVSVVIPTFNRRSFLKRCLTRLLKQDLDPASFEILVADDENNMKTRRLVAQMSLRNPLFKMIYLSTGPAHGPAAARNRGWKKASGDIIAFTDDDCLPTAQWLSSGLAAFDGQTDAVWGRVIVPLPPNPTDYQLNTAGLGKDEFVTANCFCRKSVLDKIHGFDERFYKAWREDSDLYFTLIEHKAGIKFIPQAVVIHPALKSEFGKSIWMQKNNLFEPLLYRKHPELYRERIDLPIMKMFYAIVFLLLCMGISLMIHRASLGLAALGLWSLLTLFFIRKRLLNSSHDSKHILEMVVTSVFIPPLAVFWRVIGNLRFKRI